MSSESSLKDDLKNILSELENQKLDNALKLLFDSNICIKDKAEEEKSEISSLLEKIVVKLIHEDNIVLVESLLKYGFQKVRIIFKKGGKFSNSL